MARVLAGTARRIIRIVERRGLDAEEDSLVSDEPLLALLTAASIRCAGCTVRRGFVKAANDALKRKLALEVFLADPDVPMDTNHLERALRVIPMGRKNWFFCWR